MKSTNQHTEACASLSLYELIMCSYVLCFSAMKEWTWLIHQAYSRFRNVLVSIGNLLRVSIGGLLVNIAYKLIVKRSNWSVHSRQQVVFPTILITIIYHWYYDTFILSLVYNFPPFPVPLYIFLLNVLLTSFSFTCSFLLLFLCSLIRGQCLCLYNSLSLSLSLYLSLCSFQLTSSFPSTASQWRCTAENLLFVAW